MVTELTCGIIKPEGLIHRKSIKNMIKKSKLASRLKIVASKKTLLSESNFEKIYGHTKQKLPLIYKKMKKYLTTNKVEILIIKGNNAITSLLKIRGASNPRLADKNTIRGCFAKNQDYETLYKQKKFALNVFHACDTKKEVKYIIKHIIKNEWL